MVKYSGKVILQTGERGQNILPSGRRSGKPTCVVFKKIHKKSGLNKRKSVQRCRNKIYGQAPRGNVCKKHYELEIIKNKYKAKKHLFKIYTKTELEKIYPKQDEKSKNKFSKPKCSKCKYPIFKDKLCKKHFRNRFFETK